MRKRSGSLGREKRMRERLWAGWEDEGREDNPWEGEKRTPRLGNGASNISRVKDKETVDGKALATRTHTRQAIVELSLWLRSSDFQSPSGCTRAFRRQHILRPVAAPLITARYRTRSPNRGHPSGKLCGTQRSSPAACPNNPHSLFPIPPHAPARVSSGEHRCHRTNHFLR